MNYTREQLEEQYRKLPEVLKNALLGVAVAERIYAIGTRAGFTMEEIGIVAEETGFIILGLDHPQKFIEKLTLRLKDRERARSVALEINEQIFMPLREALKSAHGMELKDAMESQKSSYFEAPRAPLPPPLRSTLPSSSSTPLTPPRPLPPPPPPPPYTRAGSAPRRSESIREELPGVQAKTSLPSEDSSASEEKNIPSWIRAPERESRVPPIDLRNQRTAAGEVRPAGRPPQPPPPPNPPTQLGKNQYREPIE